MGEAQQPSRDGQDGPIQPTFNRAICIEARRERLTADAGVLMLRELMERTGLIDWLDAHFTDARNPDLITHPMSELLRTALTLLAQGWTDADDADHLRDDPLLRLAVSDRRQDAPLRAPETAGTPDGLPSQPTLSRLLAAASAPGNLLALEQANLHLALQRCRWLDGKRRYTNFTLDIDSLPIPVHGHQDGSAYNGYYEKRCYHPLAFGSADSGQLLGAILRPGEVGTADGAVQGLRDYLDWIQRHLAWLVTVRGDAGFPSDDMLCMLEQRLRPVDYVFRVRAYAPLQEMAEPFVQAYLRHRAQTVEPDPIRLHEVAYKAKDWKRTRRVVLVIVAPEEGEMFPRTFFLITSYGATRMAGEDLLDLYRQRGTYEQQLGQFMSTLTPQLSSTTRPKRHYRGRVPRHRHAARDAFATNQALLSLNLLAYNLLNLGALIATRSHRRHRHAQVPSMTIDTFRARYLKTSARISLHSRRVWTSIAETVAQLWRPWWDYIQRLEAATMVN